MTADKKPKPPRKPQINFGLDTAEEKQLIEDVAQQRGLSVSALLRMLAFDEARRLGMKIPGDKPANQ